jgi:hypothetical protein
VCLALYLEAGHTLSESHVMAQAKGSVILALVKYLRRRRDRAVECLAPELHHYLNEDIRANGWYPEEDMLALGRVCLGLIPGADPEAVLRLAGAALAQEHIEIYGDVLGGPFEPEGRIAALWSTQHDTGYILSRRKSPWEIEFQLRDYALPSRECCLVTIGYLKRWLELNDREDVEVSELECIMQYGNACRWRATWKPPLD